MNELRGFARFERKGQHVFRTDAYLQYGNERTSIGSCLLLNPGSAEALNSYSSEIKLDATMKQLDRIIQELYKGRPINGCFHLYNLFPLQHSSSQNAIELMESLMTNRAITYEDCVLAPQELSRHPWIMIGWGLMERSRWIHLKELRTRWMNVIKEAGIPHFGIQRSQFAYCHPCPQLHEARLTMVKMLEGKYKEMLGQDPATL